VAAWSSRSVRKGGGAVGIPGVRIGTAENLRRQVEKVEAVWSRIAHWPGVAGDVTRGCSLRAHCEGRRAEVTPGKSRSRQTIRAKPYAASTCPERIVAVADHSAHYQRQDRRTGSAACMVHGLRQWKTPTRWPSPESPRAQVPRSASAGRA